MQISKCKAKTIRTGNNGIQPPVGFQKAALRQAIAKFFIFAF
jgi:hypothetical protein